MDIRTLWIVIHQSYICFNNGFMDCGEKREGVKFIVLKIALIFFLSVVLFHSFVVSHSVDASCLRFLLS